MSPLLATAAAVLALAPAASAATLVSPVGGAGIGDPPTFTWTLGQSEEPNQLYISEHGKPDSTGHLPSPFAVKGFTSAATSFTYKGHGLDYAGTYFWQLVTFDQSTSDFAYSKPARFTVPGSVTLSPLKAFDARWSHNPYETGFRAETTCNFGDPMKTRLKVTKGTKVVYDQAMATQTCGNARRAEKLDIRYPGHDTPAGTRLKATITISEGGVSASRSVSFRAY